MPREAAHPHKVGLTRETSRCRPRRPSCPWFSSVTGDVVSEEEAADPAYWAKHLTAPVDYISAAPRAAAVVAREARDAPPERSRD